MFEGKGFFRGSSILVSGSSGTGKTSIGAWFADSTCRRREKCMYFAFEESPQQIIRNMRSIGLNLDQHVKKDYWNFIHFVPACTGLKCIWPIFIN